MSIVSEKSSCLKSSSCLEECSEIKYITHAHYTKWLLLKQYPSFFNKLLKSKSYSRKFEGMKTNVTSDVIKMVEENFVKLEFNLKNDAYHEFKEVPKYTLCSFIGTLRRNY